jgi:hypothetical protein
MKRQTIVGFALGLGLMATLGTTWLVAAQVQRVAVRVASLNESGITGAAEVRELGDGRLEVDVRVAGAGAGPQPMHIHEGTCADLNPEPRIPLTDVTNGASTTELTTPLGPLTTRSHVIFIHKSPSELPVFVGCADLRVASDASVRPQAGITGGPYALLVGLASLSLAAAGYLVLRGARL